MAFGNRNPYEPVWRPSQKADPDWRKGWAGNLLLIGFVVVLLLVILMFPIFEMPHKQEIRRQDSRMNLIPPEPLDDRTSTIIINELP